ncbi:MAG: glycosyltransferase family 4 protein [Anaerolineae bacterium]
MRVLLVPNSYPPQIGGLEIAVSNIARELAARGHRVIVVTTSPSVRPSTTEETHAVRVYRLPLALPRLVFRAGKGKLAHSLVRILFSPVLAPLCLWEFVRIIKRERPDIVNLHYIADNALYVLAAQRFAEFKLVVNLHGNDIERHSQRSWPSRWLTRTALHRADMVLSNSAHILAQAERIVPAVQSNSAVVGNGVHPEYFKTRERFQHDRPYILSIGNFGEKKGFDILLHAFAQVLREQPGVDLIMAGDGHERGRCQRLAAQLGLGNAVVFLGRVDHSEVPALLNGCELFVLPSRLEPFGIVVLEAMAAGRSIVAARVGGVPEIITHMKDGFLVDPESAEALADGIDLLLSRPSLREQLGRRGRRTVAKRFTWAKICDRFEDAYCGLIGGSAP